MQYFNPKTNELSTTPPWGSSYLAPEAQVELYGDWEVKEDDFTPPLSIKATIGLLKSVFMPTLEELKVAYGGAVMLDAELAEEIRLEYQEVNAEYISKIAKIKAGEEVKLEVEYYG